MKKTELSSNFVMTVDDTNVEVSKECFQQRSAIVITNTSTGGQVISIGIGQEAVAGSGIVLNVGGSYQDSRDGQYMPSNKQINAIASAAGGAIAVHERILLNEGRGW